MTDSTQLLEMSMVDRDLWISAWCSHPVELMSEIHRRHAAAVRLRASHVCGHEDAADVTQEVFLRLWRDPSAFDTTRGPLRNYLLALAHNVAVDLVRSSARRRHRDERAMWRNDAGANPGDRIVLEPVLQHEAVSRVWAALDQLDPRHRGAIESRFFDGISFVEAARRAGVPEGTVKSRVRVGLDRLRPVLADLAETSKKKPRVKRATRSSKSLRQRLVPFAGLITLAVATAACGSSDMASSAEAADDDRVSIATTVAPITSIVASIVGDRADVTGIVPEGTNSHTFEPKPSVAELLSTADVVYMNGLQLEEPTKELAMANKRDDAEIVELGTLTLAPEDYLYDFSFPEAEGKPNPHLWTDPTLARRYAQIVQDDMSQRDAANADYYEANYRAFSAMIDDLDTAMRASFVTVPKRELLTYHDAYAYFAETYGWEVIGAIQISDFDDPTPGEVADLIDQVEASGVPAIFGSEVFPSPVLEQIGREAGVQYVDELRDDDLPGKPGDAEHSWHGLMSFDYITMTEALGGDASPLRALAAYTGVPDTASYPQ